MHQTPSPCARGEPPHNLATASQRHSSCNACVNCRTARLLDRTVSLTSLLSTCRRADCKLLHAYFELCWRAHRTLDPWHHSHTLLLSKKLPTTDPANYRPIGIHCSMYKLYSRNRGDKLSLSPRFCTATRKRWHALHLARRLQEGQGVRPPTPLLEAHLGGRSAAPQRPLPCFGGIRIQQCRPALSIFTSWHN